MNECFVFLHIIDWSVSVGGNHYTGKLHGYLNNKYQSFEVKQILTQTDAAKLNKKYRSNSYQAGNKSGKFDTEEGLFREAIKQYKTFFPNARVLFKGDASLAQAQKVLDGPEPFKTKTTEIWKKHEKLYAKSDRWNDKHEKLFQEYQKLLKFSNFS
jgi:hypothetical protein